MMSSSFRFYDASGWNATKGAKLEEALVDHQKRGGNRGPGSLLPLERPAVVAQGTSSPV
jgi:hypothetical protein